MNLNISGEIVRRLRLERGWSQEQLAQLASVNVRTIQRVEKAGACDFETRSALAAVFSIDATQLDGDSKMEQARSPNDDEPSTISVSRPLTASSRFLMIRTGIAILTKTRDRPTTLSTLLPSLLRYTTTPSVGT